MALLSLPLPLDRLRALCGHTYRSSVLKTDGGAGPATLARGRGTRLAAGMCSPKLLREALSPWWGPVGVCVRACAHVARFVVVVVVAVCVVVWANDNRGLAGWLLFPHLAGSRLPDRKFSQRLQL